MRAEVLRWAQRVLETLAPLPSERRRLLLEMARNGEGRERLRAIVEGAAEELRADPPGAGDLREAARTLLEAPPVAVKAAAALSRDGERISEVIAQVGRALQRDLLDGGWFELKEINGYGPYLYYRRREGSRKRSEYIGKLRGER